jgi:predicted small secreted protein
VPFDTCVLVQEHHFQVSKSAEFKMKTFIRKSVRIWLSCALIVSLGACNTMKGVGKDTERAGEIIQKEADQHIDEKQI